MAIGFDQLIKYLLEEIALNGEAGMAVFFVAFLCGFFGRA
jgi:hypothetical protein